MSDERREVVVTDVAIPFWSMVILLVKFSIAAIPAMVILILLAGLASIALGMIFGPAWHHWQWGIGRMV
ncbi:MAG: hypothetical protein HY661_18760 [Betaproteobacteria bacterium]|nr:hypothetical protein [Betaproteobacteria bacterium]